MSKLKIDENLNYHVTFVHCFNDNDIIENKVTGKGFYRLRNFLSDLGYQVKQVVIVKE